MPLVKAICTSCNGLLEVDENKDAAICPFCGAAYVVEKAINQYNTTNIVNNSFSGANITVEDGFNKLLNAAKGYEKLGNYGEALHTYSKIISEYPQSFEGWFGRWDMVLKERVSKGVAITEEQINNCENARKLASNEQLVLLEKKIAEYREVYKAQKPKNIVELAREQEQRKQNVKAVDGATMIAQYVSNAMQYEMRYKHNISGILVRYDDDGYGMVERIWDVGAHEAFVKTHPKAGKIDTRMERNIFDVGSVADNSSVINSVNSLLNRQGFENIRIEIKPYKCHEIIPGKYDFFGNPKMKVIANKSALYLQCSW